ncbi:HAMP domain-containing sensor histidine kinase [Vibrio sp. MarTm2]|uniref:sensor histidine kinase n=1 Tax=Vibrio sp. MarTm2 TaxID=2998831 RepID=UPI0022CD3088|nr:HAMP domain-containing sensor histidine kinase [Vibrio sp. MarTm2]MDA0129442.1 HAMP domain-containing sensor histidine kinase [Vibrio sp. MarTm2]
MSFVDDYTLTRSSVFKTLIGLFLVIALINIMVVRQVYIDSDSFHREQLTKQLNDEIMEFSYLAEQSREEVEKLLQAKKASNTPFYYRLIEHIEPTYTTQFYPISSLPNDTTNIAIGDNVKLEIGVNPQVVEAYRNALVPIVLSSIVLPIAVMLVAALFFTILILRRLENVNKAMNRVLCGERDVKLEVSQQDDEFDILAIHLNYMIEQMAKKEQTLKSLTVGMAHDMRTPMARLKLRLEDVLSHQQLNPAQQAQISACHDELELILSLFNSMLEIAKINSGQVTLQAEPVDLAKISQDAIEFISPIAEQKQLSLTFRQDQICQVKGDPSLLFRAIFNLVENAVKYTPENGQINVVVDWLGVVVADSGIGIADKDKPYVCRPMYRADKSRSEHGNGLGLSLVDAVVHQHGAELIFKDNHPGLRARILFN